jgi:hypothetical protein
MINGVFLVGVNNRLWQLIPEMIPDPVASPENLHE